MVNEEYLHCHWYVTAGYGLCVSSPDDPSVFRDVDVVLRGIPVIAHDYECSTSDGDEGHESGGAGDEGCYGGDVRKLSCIIKLPHKYEWDFIVLQRRLAVFSPTALWCSKFVPVLHDVVLAYLEGLTYIPWMHDVCDVDISDGALSGTVCV